MICQTVTNPFSFKAFKLPVRGAYPLTKRVRFVTIASMKTGKLSNGIFTRLGVAAVAVALLATGFGCAKKDAPQDEADTAWATNFDLPDADGALAKLNEIYGGNDKVFLLQNNVIARMPCPQGEAVTLNLTFAVGEYAKLILEDCVEEFNEVFSVINPNYRFTVNYTPADEDFTKKYSVKLSASSNLAVTETSQVFGVAHVNYYNNFTELGDFGITIKTEVFDNGSYLMTTFKHEMMHLLGAGDAYKNPNATKATVMQSYTVGGYHHLSRTDVAFLDALYRNPEFASRDGKIGGYVSGYEERTTHTKAALTAKVYHKLIAALDPEEVVNAGTQIGYKDLSDFADTVKGGITCDGAFGSYDIAFKEIEFAETPTETYFGSIDAENHRYWHGRQTTLGSSQGINYIDYGDGLLYAAPNGNLYTLMIKTGEYVLAFRLAGSFTNLSPLALTLWHVSK